MNMPVSPRFISPLMTTDVELASEATSRSNADLIIQNLLNAHAARHAPNGADPLPIASPITIGTANDIGTANSYSRSDHVHSHGNQLGGLLHAVATQTLDGFLSATDKTKLDGIATGATANATDAQLRDRSTHTGTQLASTISDFSTAADARITAQKGQINGLATLGADGKLTTAQIPPSLLGAANYQGTWNASTNSPAIANGTGTKGYYYVVSVDGPSTTIDGTTDWKIGDWIIFNGTIWQKVDNTDAVLSVNGKIGAVILGTEDIAESGGVQYFTTARVLATALAGLSLLTSTAITASDTIISAMGKLQAQITSLQTSKYDASNPNGYETPAQLNTRDSNNRARANHTGSQTSSTISDFASAVIAQILTGLSLANTSAVVAGDSILIAIGKLQGQINLFSQTVVASAITMGSTANAAGTSTSFARADHTHKVSSYIQDVTGVANTNTTGTTDVLVSGMTIPAANLPAGDYKLHAFAVGKSTTTGITATYTIYVGGVALSNSVQALNNGGGTLAATASMSYSYNDLITLNGSQAVELRAKTSAGTLVTSSRGVTLIRTN